MGEKEGFMIQRYYKGPIKLERKRFLRTLSTLAAYHCSENESNYGHYRGD